jgi:hypothetical protein
MPGRDNTLCISCNDIVLTEKTLEYTNPAEMILTDLPVPETISGELEISVL